MKKSERKIRNKAEKKRRKNCIDTWSSKIFLKVSPINRRHGAKTLMIHELVCTPIIDLFNDEWPLPLWLKLSFHLVCDYDWTSKSKYEFTFSEHSLFDKLVVSSHLVLAI
jgi:hypothetical protein